MDSANHYHLCSLRFHCRDIPSMALAFTTYGVNFQVFDTLWGGTEYINKMERQVPIRQKKPTQARSLHGYLMSNQSRFQGLGSMEVAVLSPWAKDFHSANFVLKQSSPVLTKPAMEQRHFGPQHVTRTGEHGDNGSRMARHCPGGQLSSHSLFQKNEHVPPTHTCLLFPCWIAPTLSVLTSLTLLPAKCLPSQIPVVLGRIRDWRAGGAVRKETGCRALSCCHHSDIFISDSRRFYPCR